MQRGKRSKPCVHERGAARVGGSGARRGRSRRQSRKAHSQRLALAWYSPPWRTQSQVSSGRVAAGGRGCSLVSHTSSPPQARAVPCRACARDAGLRAWGFRGRHMIHRKTGCMRSRGSVTNSLSCQMMGGTGSECNAHVAGDFWAVFRLLVGDIGWDATHLLEHLECGLQPHVPRQRCYEARQKEDGGIGRIMLSRRHVASARRNPFRLAALSKQ